MFAFHSSRLYFLSRSLCDVCRHPLRNLIRQLAACLSPLGRSPLRNAFETFLRFGSFDHPIRSIFALKSQSCSKLKLCSSEHYSKDSPLLRPPSFRCAAFADFALLSPRNEIRFSTLATSDQRSTPDPSRNIDFVCFSRISLMWFWFWLFWRRLICHQGRIFALCSHRLWSILDCVPHSFN